VGGTSILFVDDEDEVLVSGLRELGNPAIQELHGLLTGPPERVDRVLQQLVAQPKYPDLAQFLAIAATNEVARLRLLRAIRDA
jgi:hypothetical protein